MKPQATKIVHCRLCPKECRIPPGFSGECRIRINLDGKLQAVTYGRPCAVHVDPMEKKPLFHFLPGSPILSIGTAGCNLRCQHCQNAEISQGNPEVVPSAELTPEGVVGLARQHGCHSVAYTYTEPVVSYEYTLACAKAAHAAGLRNVLVTAAYINEKPLRALLDYIDAVNVDIKAMDERFYREVCSGSLMPVLRAVQVMRECGVHLEITNLLIPGLNDSDEMVASLCEWVVKECGSEVPLHFSRFFPSFRMTHLPPTPVERLQTAQALAVDSGLHHIYIGNIEVPGGEDTTCPGCGSTVIWRKRYVITKNTLTPTGECPVCNREIFGVWQ